MTNGARAAATILLSGTVLAGCGGPAAPGAKAATGPLAGTEWRLLEIQSMDDAVGTARPEDPSLYIEPRS